MKINYLIRYESRTPALVKGSLCEIYRGSVLDKTILFEPVKGKIANIFRHTILKIHAFFGTLNTYTVLG